MIYSRISTSSVIGGVGGVKRIWTEESKGSETRAWEVWPKFFLSTVLKQILWREKGTLNLAKATAGARCVQPGSNVRDKYVSRVRTESRAVGLLLFFLTNASVVV